MNKLLTTLLITLTTVMAWGQEYRVVYDKTGKVLVSQTGEVFINRYYEKESLDYFMAVADSGYVFTTQEKNIINTAIKLSKQVGIWDKMDVILPLRVPYRAAAKIDITGNGFNMSESNSANIRYYTSDGIASNGTSGYMEVDYIPASDAINYSLNSATIILGIEENKGYEFNDISSSSAYLSSPTGGIWFMSSNSQTMYVNLNGSSGISNVRQYAGTYGFWTLTKNDADTTHIYLNDSLYKKGRNVSVGMPNNKIRIGGGSYNSGATGNYSDRMYSFFAMGAGLSPTDVYHVNEIWNNYFLFNMKESLPYLRWGLRAQGNKTDVGTLILRSVDTVTMVSGGGAKFYDDAAGTVNENTIRYVIPDGNRIFYIKCATDTGYIDFSHDGIYYFGSAAGTSGWTSTVNGPELRGRLHDFDSLVVIQNFYYNQLLEYDFTNQPQLRYVYHGGYAPAYGSTENDTSLTFFAVSDGRGYLDCDITNLKKCTFISIGGSAVAYGDVSNLTSLTRLQGVGPYTRYSGDITNCPISALEVVNSDMYGTGPDESGLVSLHNGTGISTVNFDFALMDNIQYFKMQNSNNTVSNVDSIINCPNLNYVQFDPDTLTQNEIDAVLLAFWHNKDEPKSRIERIITLSCPGCPSPSVGILPYVDSLRNYRTPNDLPQYAKWTVTHN